MENTPPPIPEEAKAKKAPKKKGLIRWEAIIPVLVLCLLGYGYFTRFFDNHLKHLIEHVGTQANGAEVNVAGVRTSFLKGSFDLDGLEVTDVEKPSRNLVYIGNVHFQYLWDALLRMKFVVEDASINDIRALSPRKTPGRVLPPSPATPSKMEALQKEVMAQVKADYAQNMLGDLIAILEGADPKDQLEKIRGELKSEKRVLAMVEDVKGKSAKWEAESKRLTDTSKVKEIEADIRAIKAEKNFLKQTQMAKDVNDKFKEVQKQAKELQAAGKKLEGEIHAVASYPSELQTLVQEDLSSLKSRFQIPQFNVKDLAMGLFAKEFGSYLAKARKYQALAKQYLPEKKEREEVVPPPREVGKTFEFPITVSYPLFWLKRAAISSKGTTDSYTGDVTGELTNVSTSPKWVKSPIVLDLRGNFPTAGMAGVQAKVSADFAKQPHSQSVDLKVGSFAIPERMFSDTDKLRFGIKGATGASTLHATLKAGGVDMRWNGTIAKPQWLVEAKNNLAQEILSGVVEGIPVVTISGRAQGPWKNLSLALESNLGDELAKGFQAQVGRKIAEAEDKIRGLIDDKIKAPQAELMSQLKGNGTLLDQIKNADKFWKANEGKIKAEIAKLQKGGSKGLEEQGKKLLKGIKF